MRQQGWKILGVLIVCYTFVAGLLIPLKPGVFRLEPSVVQAGDTVDLQLEGYNTHFLSEGLSAWLVRRDGRLLEPLRMSAEREDLLRLRFRVPPAEAGAPVLDTLQLVLDNPVDGHFQTVLFLRQGDAMSGGAAGPGWLDRSVELHTAAGRSFPFLNTVYESIRNLYFHVPMWFAMFLLAIVAAVRSVQYLNSRDIRRDQHAQSLAGIVMLFGGMGLVTGAIWARNTWGDYWSNDPKQVYTAVGLLIYGAYFVLRGSFEDPEKRARLAAVYNVFAFSTLVPLLYILPKLSADSNHPGTGSNIAFGSQDLDNSMRMVFYPAILGWTLIGLWMAQLLYRFQVIRHRLAAPPMPR
ncbi:MAG: hypothetical protein RLY31_447 [Bacteroidota bacterium]|jgi:heme exporter protein C